MTIAVIGAGAIGSLVAGLLAKAGETILLVGRPDQVEAVRARGLRIKSPSGEETVRVPVLTAMDKSYDLVIFTVKTQDLEAAYQQNHAFLEDATVLTSQNGVQGDNLLRTHFEPENMYSSIVMFGATYIRPGEVTFNFPGDWILGKPYRPIDETTHAIAQVLGRAFPVVVTPQIMGMKWLKLFVNFNNCLPALTGRSMQETFADMDLCRLSVLLLKEGVDIIRKAGIELVSLPNFPVERVLGMAAMPVEQAAGILNKTLTTLSQEPLYGSILQSIMRGKTSEIDFINGEVILIARNLQISSPLNTRMVELVHQVERTGRFFSAEQIKKEFCSLKEAVV